MDDDLWMTSPKPLDQTVLKRLTFVRLLHQQGIEQSRLPEPLSFTSILSFHDAVEHFLVLTGEHLGAELPKRTDFLQYWSELNKDLQPVPISLSGRTAMDRLNRTRVNFKHVGAMPSLDTIEQARADVSNFLEDNTPKVFGIAYDRIDIADLVPQDEARAKVKEASEAAARGEVAEGMGLLARTFEDLFIEHVGYIGWHGSPFSFGPTIAENPGGTTGAFRQLLGPSLAGPAAASSRAAQDGLGRQIDAVTRATASMQRAFRVVAIGIDYPRFLRFDQLTPRVIYYSPDDVRIEHHPAATPDEEEFRFCERFVIEVALRLAEVSSVAVQPSWLQGRS